MDVVGPTEVFASAGRADFTRGDSKGHYRVHLIGLTTGSFCAESGLRFVPDCSLQDAPAMDTLIVPGGWGLRAASTNSAVAAWLRSSAPKIRRVASVCTGVYGLAPTGLLDGRRVTTHWRFAEDLVQRYPKLTVDAKALFIKDGRYYTSGGITAGIDLALALVEEDLGPRVALAVARELVVYLKRPGGQEQFSEPLRFQVHAADRFADLVAWISAHLGRDASLRTERTGSKAPARRRPGARQLEKLLRRGDGVAGQIRKVDFAPVPVADAKWFRPAVRKRDGVAGGTVDRREGAKVPRLSHCEWRFDRF